MKITMYELLGMVKDGKAPEKIKVHDTEYHKCILKTGIDYKIYSDDYYYLSNEICKAGFSLNDEVEILEEEKKIPEKLDLSNKISIIDVAYKINKIIDYLDYFKSKGDE